MPVNPFDITGASYFAGDDMMGLWDLSSGAGDNPFSLMGYDAALGQAIAQAQQQQGLPADPHQLAQHPVVQAAIRRNAAQAIAVNAAKAQAMKQALAQQMPGGNDRQREQILPLDSGGTTPVASLGTVNITAQPQRAFRTERLIVDSASASSTNSGGNISCSFIINNLLVGADPQFLALSGSVPASMFAPNAVGTRLKGTVAVPGIVVTVNVTNTDSASHRFLGAVLGPALD